jgi:GNAT superfamily N-acetyltransferase
MHHVWERPEFEISTNPSFLDLPRIHRFLTASYWALGIPLPIVEKSIRGSLPFGIYRIEGKSREQVGFARVVTDFATFGYLGDVYVETDFRGRGLSKWLMSCVMEHPELQELRRFCLGTRDAHSLYTRFGFEAIKQPENWMEIRAPDIYQRPESRRLESI